MRQGSEAHEAGLSKVEGQRAIDREAPNEMRAARPARHGRHEEKLHQGEKDEVHARDMRLEGGRLTQWQSKVCLEQRHKVEDFPNPAPGG